MSFLKDKMIMVNLTWLLTLIFFYSVILIFLLKMEGPIDRLPQILTYILGGVNGVIIAGLSRYLWKDKGG